MELSFGPAVVENHAIRMPYILNIASVYTIWQRIKNYWFKKQDLLTVIPSYAMFKKMLARGKWLDNGDCIYEKIKYSSGLKSQDFRTMIRWFEKYFFQLFHSFGTMKKSRFMIVAWGNKD